MSELVCRTPLTLRLKNRIELPVLELLLKPLHLLIRVPTLLFLGALAAMLLRHPDVQFYEIDRVAFSLLLIGVVARLLLLHRKPFWDRASWPMLAVSLLVTGSAVAQPFDHEMWSLLASKFLVPYAMFHMAALIFTTDREHRRFEIFAVLVAGYLSFTAIAFLAGAHSLIFPRFILDESLGFHADRARGPLLQAVANGVSLTILGLLSLHAYRRRSVRNFWNGALLFSLPIAILATMTRTVWLTFGGAVVALLIMSRNRRLRVLALIAAAGATLLGIAVLATSHELSSTVSDRWEEQGPVDFRKAVYAGGWEMFWEHPLAGWGFHRMPSELPRYVSGYDQKILFPHNTYLELLVEHGLLGFALYGWLMWELWRLRLGKIPKGEERSFLDQNFHRLWPIILIVYWVNAALVVMSYQFVNGLLFTLAGMLAGQRRRAELEMPC